jgi:hypothetical protein
MGWKRSALCMEPCVQMCPTPTPTPSRHREKPGLRSDILTASPMGAWPCKAKNVFVRMRTGVPNATRSNDVRIRTGVRFIGLYPYSLSSSPHANSFVIGPAVINNNSIRPSSRGRLFPVTNGITICESCFREQRSASFGRKHLW